MIVGQYNLTVRAKRGSVWGNFGSACLIGISSAARGEGEPVEPAYDENGNLIPEFNISGLELTAMPNPFNSETNILVSANTNEDVLISIFDMTGRLVKELNAVTNEKFVVGTELENGIYIIAGTNQAGEKSMFRIVKQ